MRGDPQAVIDAWNRLRAAPMPRCRRLTSARRAAIRRRLAEFTFAEVEAAIRRIAASPFCRGRNDRRWVATIDFLLRPNTVAKALEGVYDPPGAAAEPAREAEALRTLWRAVGRDGRVWLAGARVALDGGACRLETPVADQLAPYEDAFLAALHEAYGPQATLEVVQRGEAP